MTNLLSAQHAAKNICLHWKDAGFEIGEAPLGASVNQEFGQDLSAAPVAALYVFVDEYLALLRYATYYFLSAVPQSGQRAMVFNRLAVRQLRTVAAIRALCALGLDGNARVQLRLLHELSLLWVRVRIDPQALEDFQAANSPETSNAFWHRYISKGKNEKWLEREFANKNHVWLGAFDKAIEELKLKVSITAHPSFLQAYLDSREDWGDQSDRFILGSPSNASHFTLSMTLLAAATPFSLKPEPAYGLTAIDMRTRGTWHPVHSEAIDWETYNQKLRDMFPRLFLASIRFSQELREAVKGDKAQPNPSFNTDWRDKVAPAG